jgi:hypothetical protein
MNLKLTLTALAVASFVGSVQAQVANAEANAKSSYLTTIGATAAWSRGITGKGSIIAVVDQGFALDHTDIKGNLLEAKNFYPGTVTNWGLHGTEMASIAGGVANNSGTVGVAPDAKLLLAQVGSGGTTTGVSMASVLQAMTWADSKGATVINLSLGATYDANFKAGTTMMAPGIYRADPRYTNTSTGAMASVFGNKISDINAFATATRSSVIVASAGNSGTGYAQFPGAFATQTDANGNLLLGGRVLIIGNVKADGKGGWVMDASSNQAGSICSKIVGNACQDKYYVKDFYVVAPGSSIWGAVPDQARSLSGISSNITNGAGGVSGTSPAAAEVSGGIALMHQAWPQLKASQLVQVVLNTATSLGDSNVYGKGMVNFDKATQPYADIKYSKAALTSGTPVGGTALTATGASLSINSLRSSTVLANVQVVDGINRNFTSDFTKAMGVSNPANSLYTSPYLAINAINYREFAVPYGKDTVLTFMQSQNGFASQVDTAYGNGRLQLQVGAMTEQNGFLNNYGSGLLGMGNSNTTYAMVGGSTPITGSVDLIGSYGLGITRTSNAQDSMLALSSTIISDTWKVGLAKKDIFFSGKTKDQVTFAVQGPVSVRRGYADVTAVTGYTYSGADDNVTASPTSTTERVNLANNTRQTDLVLGYNVSVGNTTYAGINFARQFNVGGMSGQTGNAVGVMVRSVF